LLVLTFPSGGSIIAIDPDQALPLLPNVKINGQAFDKNQKINISSSLHAPETTVRRVMHGLGDVMVGFSHIDLDVPGIIEPGDLRVKTVRVVLGATRYRAG